MIGAATDTHWAHTSASSTPQIARTAYTVVYYHSYYFYRLQLQQFTSAAAFYVYNTLLLQFCCSIPYT